MKTIPTFLLLATCFLQYLVLTAQTTFGPQQVIIQSETNGASSVYAADLNGDGDMDILSVSLFEAKIVWYENDGLGNFGVQQIISTAVNGPKSVFAADLDGDGNIDVLSASQWDDKIAWYRNLGLGNFGPQQIISTIAGSAQSVYAADLDGDGDLDVLSASISNNKIAWYENDGMGNFGAQQIISTFVDEPYSVYANDLDNDGDMDVFSASKNDNTIACFRNDGAGNFGFQEIITTTAMGARSVYAADLDGDGYLDVLSASGGDDVIAWYQSTGTGYVSFQQIISSAADDARFVYTADLDGDGDIDVLSASYNDNKIAWYENDSTGNFGTQQIISTTAKGAVAVFAADLDGDGDIDVLSASYLDNEISWYENDGSGNFGVPQVISGSASHPVSVYAADLDGDGDLDVLSASFTDDKIAWYENNASGNFIPQHVISSIATGAWSVYAADLDGDGDTDVLSAGANKVAWYENDGAGNFGAQQIISTDVIVARSVYAADLDGDGDLDVLSASAIDDKIAWYENDGNGNFGAQQIISTEADGAKCVYAADLDGDGDLDVLSAYYSNYSGIAWYQNDGTGNFGAQQIISTAVGPKFIRAADIDNDGNMDIICAYGNGSAINVVAYYKNNGIGNFTTGQIITTDAIDPYSVYVADLDIDGDIDVLTASVGDDKIAWYENDGAGNFGVQQIISTTADGARFVYAADLDGDGDLDVLSASYLDNKITWYENLLNLSMQVSINNLPCIGASNGSVLVQMSGGAVNIIPPYTYTWVSDAGTSGSGTVVTEVFTIDNLAAGAYAVTVTNNAGNTATGTVILNPIPGSVFEITDITTTNSSNSLPNGSIQLTMEGGAAPFTVWWSGVSNGTFSNNNQVLTIYGLLAGSYNITITDAEGKQVSQTVLLLDETTPQTTCNTPLDIVILNDVSGSVDAVEYAESKQFFVDFINALNIGLADTQSRAAIIEWSGNAQQQIRIPITGNLATLQSYVTYSRTFNGGTNPNEALTFGHNYLQSAARPFATKILVLSTDGSLGQVSSSLVALAETYKAQGYIVVTIAFDDAYSNLVTRNLLTQAASIPLLAPGAPAYSQLTPNLANNIVNLYVCPADPGSSNTYYFYRDGAIDITGYTVEGFCPNPTGITLHYTVTAQQQLSLPAGTPITFYYNNPALFSSTPILTTFIPCAIPAGSSETLSTYLPINSPAQVFAVLNDNGSQSPPISFPITPIAEHVYVNNTDNIAVCTDPVPTVAASLAALTPVPVCGNTVFFTLSACNIGVADAENVGITANMPAGFVLLNQNIHLNGCAQVAGANNTFNLPAGCCVAITLEYNVSGATSGFYNNQQVLLSGSPNQVYINFNGITTSADDVTITGTPDCPSDAVAFTKSAAITQTCDDSFVTYAFTIHNQTNLPLQGLQFTDILPPPVIWAAEPYQPSGLSIGQTDITGKQIANFTIAQVQPNTLATFYLDAYLGNWSQNGSLPNSATLSGLPDFVNGNGNPLTAYAETVTVVNNPDIFIATPVTFVNCQNAQLSATLTNGANPQWLTGGDGVFTHPNSPQTTYLPGANDLLNGLVELSLGAQNECGNFNASVEVVFNPIPNCNDNDCNTDDLFNPDTCQCEHLPIAPPDCNDNNEWTTDTYNPDDCLCQNTPIAYVLLLPNAFSPNADGENDLFRATYNFPVTHFYLAVYNRWGQQVFETTDINQGWNGLFNQVPAPMGVYTWYALYRSATNNTDNRISGNVTLVR